MRKKKAEADEVDVGASPQASAGSVTAATKSTAGGRLTPLDIQQIEFRRSFKGYDEREVDEFLDRLTEDFAAALDEAQRLRDRAEGGLGAVVAGSPDRAATKREAEGLVARARDEADRIVRGAEARAAALAVASTEAAAGTMSQGDRSAISSFIGTERTFLTSLAALVQGHAETVKQMASSAQKSTAAPSAASAATPSTPTPTPTTTEAARPARASDSAGPSPATPAPERRPRPSGATPGPPQPMPPVEPAATASPPPSPPADAREPSTGERASGSPTPPGEGHVTIPEPNPAGVANGDPELAESDPALRELFWGED